MPGLRTRRPLFSGARGEDVGPTALGICCHPTVEQRLVEPGERLHLLSCDHLLALVGLIRRERGIIESRMPVGIVNDLTRILAELLFADTVQRGTVVEDYTLPDVQRLLLAEAGA